MGHVSFAPADETIHFELVTQKISESGAAEGEDVHVLGFPIGVLSDQLFGPERSYPVARRASIAWIRPALDKVNLNS